METNIHNAANYPATPAGKLNTSFLRLLDRVHQSGANYHISDERTIGQHGKVEKNLLHLGRCAYRTVVLSDGVMFNAGEQHTLALFQDAGGILLHAWPNAPCATVAAPQSAYEVRVDWRVLPGTTNELVIEAATLGGSRYSARFESTASLGVQIVFFDDVENITANGASLGNSRTFLCLAGGNELRFSCNAGNLVPFISIRGTFAVQSKTPFLAGPNGALATDGPFVLHEPALANAENLIASGHPFCREAVKLRGIINLSVAARALCFPNTAADCIQVTIDGKDRAWCWGADWTVPLPTILPPGHC